ncbi:MAG: alpha/beta hydrolase [Burkholderiales bacterium]|jgi:pimeloyl-ACP methyl ester carboxylesterase
MWEREFTRKGELYIQMPGLVTGTLLEQIAHTQGDGSDGAFDLPTKRANVGGTELNYFEIGEGEPVVFVHGSIGDYRTWGYQFEAFAQRYRVISYSRRYHYPNTWVGDGMDYSSALHAEDLAGFIRALGFGPVHLIGQSYGAVVAAHCARHHPDLVCNLALIEPSIVPWLEHIEGGPECMEPFVNEVMAPASRAMTAGNADEAVRIFCDGVLGAGTFESLSPEMQAAMLDNAPEFKAELEAPMPISPFSFEDARRISVPTLSVEGGSSIPWLTKVTEKFASLVPNIERVSIEDSPHAVHFVTPQAFNAAVLDFLERHPRQ